MFMDAIIRTYARNIVNFDNWEHIINCYFIKVAEILGFYYKLPILATNERYTSFKKNRDVN